MLPIFNKQVITDGDNVESEDFLPGKGGVVIPKKSKPAPVPYRRLSAEEKKARDYFYMTDDDKQRIDDEHLAKHGI